MELPAVHYDQAQQWVLNAVLAALMLGVALDIHPEDFRRVVRAPKAPLVAMPGQFLLLPGITWAATLLLDLPPGVELGMILVSCCPGGNLSNVMTHLAGGNAALSISMTALASCLAIVLLPLDFAFWSSLNPETHALLVRIAVEPREIFLPLLLVLGLPLALGQLVVWRAPGVAARLHRALRALSFAALVAFIVVGLAANRALFADGGLRLLVGLVILHNALAFGIGYGVARSCRLDARDTRAVTIEVGMQNSSLALAIAFSRFASEPATAVVAALWGIWHIVAGLGLAALWSRRKRGS